MIAFIEQIEKGGTPIFQQIIEAAKKAPLNGQLKFGEKFPSVRELSKHLKISPTTVHKAIKALTESGYLIKHRGVGMNMTVPQEERMELLKSRVVQLATEAVRLEVYPDEMSEALQDEMQRIIDANIHKDHQRFRERMWSSNSAA